MGQKPKAGPSTRSRTSNQPKDVLSGPVYKSSPVPAELSEGTHSEGWVMTFPWDNRHRDASARGPTGPVLQASPFAVSRAHAATSPILGGLSGPGPATVIFSMPGPRPSPVASFPLPVHAHPTADRGQKVGNGCVRGAGGRG